MENIAQLFQNSLPGGAAALGGSMGGNMAQFEELTKALQASDYQTDVSKLQGGGALGVQSLDTAMKTTIQENKHFTLFNMLQQTKAINIVDEFSRQSSVGGFLGGSTNSQMGVVRAAQGEYSREVGLVKFLMSLRQVGYVLNIGKNISEPIAVEERNGALQLLTDANYLLYHGNADVVGTQFDGIFTQIDKEVAAGKMAPEHVVDMNGTALNTIEPMSQINVQASAYGNWGQSTDIFLPNSVQNDLNMNLDPAFRWMPDGNNTPTLGGQVDGIRLTTGTLKTHMDTFIHDETNPMVHVFQLTNPDIASANNSKLKPATVTGAAATNGAARFTGSRAGAYVYAVAGISTSGAGMSEAVIVDAVTVASGEEIALTIANVANTDCGGFAIYRGRQGVAKSAQDVDTLSDLRLVGYIKKAASGTTVFHDDNRSLPGTVSVPMLNLAAGADAIGWRQFQPMTKIPLPFGVGGMPVMSWFQFLFGYLRMTKPKHHGYIKNVLPTQAKWRPHTGE